MKLWAVTHRLGKFCFFHKKQKWLSQRCDFSFSWKKMFILPIGKGCCSFSSCNLLPSVSKLICRAFIRVALLAFAMSNAFSWWTESAAVQSTRVELIRGTWKSHNFGMKSIPLQKNNALCLLKTYFVLSLQKVLTFR